MENSSGSLYIVATPIGNLEDITYRAVKILKEVDLIAAEDTRTTGRLLAHYGIQTNAISYHDHNKEQKTPGLVGNLQEGLSIAIVSDAGTPGISDPAFYLVREAVRADIEIIPVPGPSASIAALVASGLPTDRWVFEGFLPRKKGRHTRLTELQTETRTLVIYESPYRVIKTLNDIQKYWGDRQVAVGREITKKFEEFVRGTCTEIIEYYNTHTLKGEFVLVVQGKPDD
jgi:16S rRNA (cytidine1402-2'-O)-methyltransferase